jgi:sugar phosphate isomerase/epimerase
MAVKIGIQLYSVRDSLSADPGGTLEALADLGFTRFEGANHQALEDSGIGFGISAEFLRDLMSKRGLSVVGCHINPLDENRLPAVLDFHQHLGNPRIGCDIEFYPYNDRDYVKRRAELFNRVGQLCADRGMEFYYHNHFEEFQEFGDTTVYQLLMDNTDPALVRFEMDTYWAYRGGADPIEWFREYPDRFILIHQKDFPTMWHEPINLFDGVVARDAQITMDLFDEVVKPQSFAEIGTGQLPIQDIINAADKLPNFRYLLLEQDFAPGAELDSVKISRDALRGYANVEW